MFCYGLVFGSFSNVLIDRIESGESALLGRSHCDFCKKTLRWYELVPVLSYLLQRGTCRRCHRSLSIQYPIVELMSACGYVVLYSVIPFGLPYVCAAIIFSSCLVMAIADYKYQIIPDEMVVLGSICSLVYVAVQAPYMQVLHHGIAAVGSMAFFYLLWFFTKGKGMGFGDVKLSGMMGLLLGFPSAIFAFYFAFLTGAALGVILILAKNKTLKSKIAFGPFLLLGLLFAIMFEKQLVAFWHTYIIFL